MRSLRTLLLLAMLGLGWVISVNAQEARTIEVGETVNDTLDTGTPQALYRFSARAGDLVSITLSSEAFDSLLTLFDEQGNQILSDDDSAGNLNARLLFLPETDGVYSLTVGSAYDDGVGDYTLSLNRVKSIEKGQTINGSLSGERPSVNYSFNAQTGDFIIITMTSGAFDSYLSLSDTSGAALSSDDDSAGDHNARLSFSVPATGTYVVTAGSFGDPDGDFELTLDMAAVIDLAYGETATVELNDESLYQYFRFEGKAGDVVDIRAESDGTVDTNLTLTSPLSYLVTSDDDSGGDGDPLIASQILAEDGEYLIYLAPNTTPAVGSLAVSLTTSEVKSLDEGAQTVEFSDVHNDDVFSFDGAAGERVRVIVNVDSEGGASPYVEISQAGTAFSNTNAYTVQRVALDMLIPADGPVYVRVQNYGGATITVSVEHGIE